MDFFTSDFIDSCDDIQHLIAQITIDHYSVSKLKYQNLNSFSYLLLLLSGDTSLNPGPVYQDTLHCLNELNVFKKKVYILFILISIVYYLKPKNFVLLQDLLICRHKHLRI